MNATEARELSEEELTVKARELRNELFNVKIKHATGQLDSTAKLQALRRDIARVETVLTEKLGASK